jgi:hypothetical protein
VAILAETSTLLEAQRHLDHPYLITSSAVASIVGGKAPQGRAASPSQMGR